MSELDDFMALGFDDFSAIVGAVSFTIEGIAGSFTCTLDRFAVDKEELRPRGGGRLSDQSAVLVAGAAQFAAVDDLETTLPQKRLTIEGRVWRILSAEKDTVFVTLRLENWKR